jgi:hypothetical protein
MLCANVPHEWMSGSSRFARKRRRIAAEEWAFCLGNMLSKRNINWVS